MTTLVLLLLTLSVAQAAETPQQRTERMAWWRKARFGMFIHWGPVLLKSTEISWSRARYLAFWDNPGFDELPDMDHGGSAMVGLQEMLLQTDGKIILLFPAWPKECVVDFKLRAPYQTTVEATVRGGKVAGLKVVPESCRKDIELNPVFE